MRGARSQRSRTAPPAILLASQASFNVGFYAVIPFLAITMRDDFALGGAAIGLVLGIRTFCQQGLFLIGGLLSDRFGAKNLILIGCAVRVVGYLSLGLAGDLTGFVVGAVLTGFGGALFSPALESLVGAADVRAERDRPNRRTSLFAGLVLVGEMGAAIGPVIGSFLLGYGFSAAVGAGAVVFTIVGIVLWAVLPGESPSSRKPARLWSRPAFDRRFVVFAVFFSVNLLAYNQLYLGLSFEIARAGSGPGALGGLFLLVSVLTIGLQWPLAVVARRLGPARAFTIGFGTIALGFLAVAILPTVGSTIGSGLVPAITMTALLAVGHMIVGPMALELVPRFAGAAPLGAHYGLLATCGGSAVLLSSLVLGPLFAASSFVLAWTGLAVLALLSAAVLRFVLPPSSTRPSTPSTERHHAPSVPSDTHHRGARVSGRPRTHRLLLRRNDSGRIV